MKTCKIIHINDGTPTTITNGNRHFAEEFPWASELIGTYLNEGYAVKQIIPSVTPTTQELGNLTFYSTGFTVYLEKD